MTKCSGHCCIQRDVCLHYAESLKKNMVKGKWINAEKCINPIWDHSEEKMLKPPFSELLLES